jgi:lipopolysaccharide export system permease protein
MKKLDKLIISSFIGPFFLTFFVVIFILLLQFLLRYFQDLVGKGLGLTIYAKLLGYFSINMTPSSFPLAVLLSCLITYGNLGEHSELNAIKTSGIPMTRTLVPIFIISIMLMVAAYISNNYIVPKANLKAYSLLWDIKNKTPALNLKEGVFYGDIPGYQIKVARKYADGKSLKDVIIYNHSKSSGNTEVTLADSGQMFTILNQRYLVMDLFNGRHYSEQQTLSKSKSRAVSAPPYARSEFKYSRIIFSMASFDLKRTKEELFKGNRVMKNVAELRHDVDSMQSEVRQAKYRAFLNIKEKYKLLLGQKMTIPEELLPEKNNYYDSKDTASVTTRPAEAPTTIFSNEQSRTIADTARGVSSKPKKLSLTHRQNLSIEIPERSGVNLAQQTDSLKPRISWEEVGADSILHGTFNKTEILKKAVTEVRFIKNHFMMASGRVKARESEIIRFEIQRYKIFSQAFACIIMFMIGAPLGAIIKKGGLGVPVIVSIGFFIVYYVFTIIGEKWAKQELIGIFTGVWLPNYLLIPVGLIFLQQARKDAKLFDADFYLVTYDQAVTWLRNLLKKKN